MPKRAKYVSIIQGADVNSERFQNLTSLHLKLPHSAVTSYLGPVNVKADNQNIYSSKIIMFLSLIFELNNEIKFKIVQAINYLCY